MSWESTDQHHDIPAVYHSAWQSPTGKFALVAANWTTESQEFELKHERLPATATEWISSKEMQSRDRKLTDNTIRVTLPPLSCGLVEAG